MIKFKYIIHTDGGSRGNPGPSAIGVVIEGEGIKKEYSEYIGEGTNNEAEYKAVVFALRKLKTLVGKENTQNSEVEVIVDSELLTKQLNNEYRVKDKEMRDLYMDIHNSMFDFEKVTFKHVYREDNKEADKLVNIALNKETNKLL